MNPSVENNRARSIIGDTVPANAVSYHGVGAAIVKVLVEASE
jgi:hypothetical protein